MEEPILTLSCSDSDRTRPLVDGRIGVDGFRLAPVVLPPQNMFPRAVRRAEFDVTEMSASSYIVQLSRGTAQYVAVPVFLSRSFRLDSIYIRSDRGIRKPEDLAGRSIGIPEYQLTLCLWVRGILQDRYGVNHRSVRYRTGGINVGGREERVPLKLPGGIDVRPLPSEVSLNEALLAGDIDAVFSPIPPTAFVAGAPSVQRLFDRPGEEERAYFRDTGMFPIMHVLGIRKDVVDKHPSVTAAVVDAFERARKIALDDLAEVARAPVARLTLPWLAECIAEFSRVMGPDPWPYGIDRNRAELQTMCRYAYEQGLAERLLTVDELFPSSGS